MCLEENALWLYHNDNQELCFLTSTKDQEAEGRFLICVTLTLRKGALLDQGLLRLIPSTTV